MRIVDRGEKKTIPGNTPYAHAIRSIIEAYEQRTAGNGMLPERNDIKALWRQLRDEHKALLHVIAKKQGVTGVGQPALEKALGVDWEKLRGVHNGLARICAGLDMENPIRTIGYNRSNRHYQVDASTAETVVSLWKRDHQ